MLRGVLLMAATIQEWRLPGLSAQTGIFYPNCLLSPARVKLLALTRSQVCTCWDLKLV